MQVSTIFVIKSLLIPSLLFSYQSIFPAFLICLFKKKECFQFWFNRFLEDFFNMNMLKQLLRQGVLHRTKQVIFPENKQHVREFDILFLQLFAELHLKHDRYQNFQSSSLARKSCSHKPIAHSNLTWFQQSLIKNFLSPQIPFRPRY